MTDPFVHLHVASGYSLQYGASHPHTLVERAVDHEMDTLALTDRDGCYGAVRFVKACRAAGVRPILGVDLAFATSPDSVGEVAGDAQTDRRSPVRGGTFREPRLPRVTFLASGRRGWAALCRLVSATHLSGERGVPVCTLDLVAEHLGPATGSVLVLLGPDSEVGRAATRRRDDLARAVLRPWLEVVDRADLLVEVVSHRRAGSGPGSSPHAARMAGVAHAEGVRAVLTNAVRYADRADAPIVDVLDAARRLVPLGSPDLRPDLRQAREGGSLDSRSNAEGFLKSGKQMAEVAEEICRFAGLSQHTGRDAHELLAGTRTVADRCALDPREDLGMGEVHFPELPLACAADQVLRARCETGISWRYGQSSRRVLERLEDELAIIHQLGYASYFLTVGDITDLIRERGVRCAARGSGAGSLVTYLLGISGVDPLRYGLLMERFLSPLRQALPDIDVDVESARRLEIYQAILDRYGESRCVCVSMMDTYRVRHAVRDVGAALGMPLGEIDTIAKAFPHIRARDARAALRELPELRAFGLVQGQSTSAFDLFFRLVERLDGLPRHIAVHPCGVLLSDATLLDRTPVEASAAGFPMSQFDKEDVEDLGMLKLDVLGVRMQSSMAHAVAEIERVDHVRVDLDDRRQVPLDDEATFALISAAKTLGCFQIESPGQRELVGKSGIESFEDIITDISLFRPGPVKSDMVTPYLRAKQGWAMPHYLHDDLRPILRQTRGVVVFHEQVIEIIATLAGCTLAEADEARRALGDVEGMAQAKLWFFPRALGNGYSQALVEQVWKVLEAFASFGFCKAHAAAFALPTYQSAWLKAHWPAHFMAGVLTHDPGMYPKRLILDDARQCGVTVLGLDVNTSMKEYVVEKIGPDGPVVGYGIRLALSEVKGISEAEVDRIVANRPFGSLADFWERARASRPVVERLVLAGGFDSVHGIEGLHGPGAGVVRRGRATRRDLLLAVADLDVRSRAARRSGGSSAQLSLDFADAATDQQSPSGLPEMTASERVAAELEILGLDVSAHVMDFYAEFLEALCVTRSADLLTRRSRAELLVAGVKVATQTPPIRSGRRVIFVTLDDATGPVDATFFEDVQGPYAATVFGSWLLLVRGELRRTGRRGVSLRATGCWALPTLHETWRARGMPAVRAMLAEQAPAAGGPVGRRVLVHSSGFAMSPYSDVKPSGEDVKSAPKKLWYSSPGSPG
ncbi:MAG TPA: DNA polymerase III subunit alpha [Nocardioidaceae bacterium]|nr:DNA polymerase III subunit alpha [Nocardioidaceae bacterium]